MEMEKSIYVSFKPKRLKSLIRIYGLKTAFLLGKTKKQFKFYIKQKVKIA